MYTGRRVRNPPPTLAARDHIRQCVYNNIYYIIYLYVYKYYNAIIYARDTSNLFFTYIHRRRDYWEFNLHYNVLYTAPV